LWTNHIEAAAEKLEEEQKFEEANEILRKTFNYNPLNGYVYYSIGWNNYRLNELDESNLLAKKAIELSPKNSNNYSLQAAIYSSKKMHELAVENYKIALDLSNNMKEKAIIYCNMSNDYIELYSPSTAKDLLYKSLEINPSDAYCYWRIARIFRIMKNQDSSLINFEKAINKKPMDNYLQQLLYFDYSTELFNEFKLTQEDKRNILLEKAMSYSTKALNLDPENEEYKKLLEEIKKFR
jgi:tetratricopeptide (TPR) repeat protein